MKMYHHIQAFNVDYYPHLMEKNYPVIIFDTKPFIFCDVCVSSLLWLQYEKSLLEKCMELTNITER